MNSSPEFTQTPALAGTDRNSDYSGNESVDFSDDFSRDELASISDDDFSNASFYGELEHYLSPYTGFTDYFETSTSLAEGESIPSSEIESNRSDVIRSVQPDALPNDILQNSLIISEAVYEDDPCQYLNSERNGHSLKSYMKSQHTECSFLIAESADGSSVYISFRGTSNWKDLLKDLEIKLIQVDKVPYFSSFHAGFLERAEIFPLAKIINSDLVKDKTLVFCGHSMGGAVSSIVYILALQKHRSESNLIFQSIRNVTFGSPLFGDNKLAEFIKYQKIDVNMDHYVHRDDPVPRLLNLSKFANFLQTKHASLDSDIKNKLEVVLSCLRSLISAPCDNSSIQSVRNVINGAWDVLSAKESEISEKFTPIGNFLTLTENETTITQCFDPKKFFLTFPELVSQSNWQTHCIKNYMRALILPGNIEMDTFVPEGYGDCCRITSLDPVVKSAKLTLNRNKTGQHVSSELFISGANIAEVCLKKSVFNLGFTFGDNFPKVTTTKLSSIEDMIVIKQPANESHLSLTNAGFSISLSTYFGDCEYLCTDQSNIENKEISAVWELGKKDELSLVLKASIQRALTFAKIDKTPVERQKLYIIVYKLASKILPSNDLVKWKAHFSNSEDDQSNIDELYQKIEKMLYKPITLLPKLSSKRKVAVGGSAAIGFVAGSFFAYQLSKHLDPNRTEIACISSVGWGSVIAYEVGRSADGSEQMTENDYYLSLQYTVDVLFISSSQQLTDTEKKQLQFLRDSTSIYSMEKALLSLAERQEPFKAFEASISEPSRKQLQRKIKLIRQTHRIRSMICSQCVIALVGPQNSGKTLFMNEAWGLTNPVGLGVHTDKIILEKFEGHSLIIADFPGSTSLNEYARSFYECSVMNNIIVLILPFLGDVDETHSKEIADVYESTMCTEGSQIMICFNQCGYKVNSLEEELGAVEDPAEYFKYQITEKINEYYKRTNLSIRIQKNDIFFTDWIHKTNEFSRFKLSSMKDIKVEIESRRRMLSLYSSN